MDTDTFQSECFGDDISDHESVISSIISSVKDDIKEINYLHSLTACIEKTNLNGAIVKITFDANVLLSNFTEEQLQAMTLSKSSINIIVHINDLEMKILHVSQNDKPNVIEGSMIYVLEYAILSFEKTYKNHKIPYDTFMLDTLTEIGDIGLCIYALLKYKNRIDDAYIYVLENQDDVHDAIDIMSAHNNIAFIANIFLKELPQICQKCLLCHCPLDYNCIKPTICNGKLCQMQFSTMGIGFSLENEITNNGKVTDLLISLFVIIMNKQQRDDRLDMSFFNNYGISFNQVQRCIELIPSISEMSKMIDNGTFAKNLMQLDPFLIPLLRWIISSNMTYLKPCSTIDIPNISIPPNNKEIFVMKTSTLEKEKVFNSKKTRFGVKYLYHGSACHNWHLILKHSLKNYSDTRYMTTGAAYGNGIYLSSDISIASHYSFQCGHWKNSMYGKISLIALCEVAAVPELSNKTNGIFTLTDEDALITRYLLVR